MRENGKNWCVSAAAMAALALLACIPLDETPAGEIYVDGDGVPELTGAPTYASVSVAAGTEARVLVPVDSDTQHLFVSIYDVATDSYLVHQKADNVTPGASADFAISIPSTTTPGTFYAEIEVCSSLICDNPFKRTVYRPQGGSPNYFRTGFESPPLTEVDAARDSGIAIPTFEIQ